MEHAPRVSDICSLALRSHPTTTPRIFMLVTLSIPVIRGGGTNRLRLKMINSLDLLVFKRRLFVLAQVDIYDQVHHGLYVAVRTGRSGKYRQRTCRGSYVDVSRVGLRHKCHMQTVQILILV